MRVAHVEARDGAEDFVEALNTAIQAIDHQGGAIVDIKYATDRTQYNGTYYSALILWEMAGDS